MSVSAVGLTGVLALGLAASASAVDAGATRLVSVAAAGGPANGASTSPSISADGRYITYSSAASNLVPGDTNGIHDVFLHDTTTATTTRISTHTDGTQSNDFSYEPAISPDGRYITYSSSASNLVPGDTNNTTDVFLHDATPATTTHTAGTQSNGFSYEPAISADGRYITYSSSASNLVPGDTNNEEDVFLTRTHVPDPATPAPAASAQPAATLAATGPDGKGIAFVALAALVIGGAIVGGLPARRTRAS